MSFNEQTLATIIDAVHTGKQSAGDLAKQAIAAMQAGKDINAVICTDEACLENQAAELDRKLADGQKLPLHGVPVLVKDNIHTADFPTTAGTPGLANNRPTTDAGVVRRLKEAGALITGKANMHELAFGITSNNGWTGAVHNPYDKNMIPGGSSGGSAAAVSAGIVPAALGSDTGGSNRIPAALCGISGFRPSLERYPGDGVVNLSLTRDTVGVFARKVNDIAILDKVLACGAGLLELKLSDLRLAVPRNPFYKALENETADVIDAALNTLASAGATLVEIDMPEVFPLNDKISMQVAVFETIRELTDYLDENDTGMDLAQLTAAILSPDVKQIMEAAQGEAAVPEEVYLEALNTHRPLLIKMYADYFADNDIDAMLYPTSPVTARPIGHDQTIDLNGHQMPTFSSFTRNGDPSSNAGIPSLSLPVGMAGNGLPVGLSVDGPVNQDERVLAIGAAIQASLPAIPLPGLS